MNQQKLSAVFIAAIWTAASLSPAVEAAPLSDLSAGQTGRIEFTSSTPDQRWALIRGRLGPEVTVYGDLLMPTQASSGKVPAVVFSHGSEGVSSCRIPDDCIDSKRYPLFMARAVLKKLIESLQSTPGVTPC
ncbi:hypothetical protein [Acidovorax sp. 56]|uniref:hypothetical protein n=1 Tax=Acidovorax sp. 56 TaxID=2035205 RepID=UPI001E4234E3|nr:hypothetical protein [Acidovorax sp. 56]